MDVAQRIEEFVLEWLRSIAQQHEVPPLNLPALNDSNAQLCAEEGAPAAIVLGDKLQPRRLESKSSRRYAQLVAAMSIIHRGASEGRTLSQRDVYYCLKDEHGVFKNQQECNTAILEVGMLLRMERYEMGILAAARGYISGLVAFTIDGHVTDCTSPGICTGGVQITSDWLLESRIESITSSASFILVVEKQAIFHRLCEDRVWTSLPCILVTGCGFPDVATRACLHALATRLQLSVVGLSDFNPFGLAIMLVYKLGSVRSAVEGSRFAIPDLKWAGLRANQLDALHLPRSSFIQWSKHDYAKAQAMLKSSFMQVDDAYANELQLMIERGVKCELEALFARGLDFLMNGLLVPAIVSGDFL